MPSVFSSHRQPRVAYILGAKSWIRWLHPFFDDAPFHPILFARGIGDLPANISRDRVTLVEDVSSNAADRAAQIAGLDADAVVHLPHQDTLLGDVELVERLRETYGDRLVATSKSAASFGADKYIMKQTLARLAVPTPKFEPVTPEAVAAWRSAAFPIYAKHSLEHEGNGNTVLTSVSALDAFYHQWQLNPAPSYFERFSGGEELSTICAGVPGCYVSLPLVFKGESTISSPHPARRIRLCVPTPTHGGGQKLDAYGQSVAGSLATAGLLEVEAMEVEAGLSVFEINMRLAGTLRMSMLASGMNVVSWLGELALGSRERPRQTLPSRYVCELPVDEHCTTEQRAKIDALPFVAATTRATISAETAGDLVDRAELVGSILNQRNVAPCIRRLLQIAH